MVLFNMNFRSCGYNPAMDKRMNRDLELLQGAWRITGLELDGQRTPADAVGDATLVIDGNRFTSIGMGAEYGGLLDIETSTNPHRLNMRFDLGPEKGNTNLAIYTLDGDTWTLCIATRGNARPSTFQAPADSGIALETLVRVTGSHPAVPKRKEKPVPRTSTAGEFEGEWKMVSGVMNGRPMDESLLKWVRRTFAGDVSTVQAGPQTMLKVQFTTDASTSPKSIDYLNLAGSNKGKTQLGIYRYDGDLLTINVAAAGAPRPASFDAAAGDTLTVWKRA